MSHIVNYWQQQDLHQQLKPFGSSKSPGKIMDPSKTRDFLPQEHDILIKKNVIDIVQDDEYIEHQKIDRKFADTAYVPKSVELKDES